MRKEYIPTQSDIEKAEAIMTDEQRKMSDKRFRFVEFEKVKTPKELLSFMKKNIHYGFIGEQDNKIYSPEFDGWGEGEQPKAKFQNSKDLLASGYGGCWEQTELERQWFSKNKYEFKTYLIMFGKDIGQKNPAHMFLAYKDEDKWHWFENSYEKNNGIHEYENLFDLIRDTTDKLKDSAIKNGATTEDMDKFKLFEYNSSLDDCSNGDEFLSKIIEQGKQQSI